MVQMWLPLLFLLLLGPRLIDIHEVGEYGETGPERGREGDGLCCACVCAGGDEKKERGE